MDRVNICGIPHQIIKCNQNFSSEYAELGQIDYSSAVIKLREGMPKELEEQTLMHEVLHGLLLHSGYTDLCQNEQFVTGLSMAMCSCLKIVRM